MELKPREIIHVLPMSNYVIVHPDATKEATASGIIIPDTVQTKAVKGTVVCIGVGESGKEMYLKVGDRVTYSQYTGTEVTYEEYYNEGVTLLQMRESDVQTILLDKKMGWIDLALRDETGKAIPEQDKMLDANDPVRIDSHNYGKKDANGTWIWIKDARPKIGLYDSLDTVVRAIKKAFTDEELITRQKEANRKNRGVINVEILTAKYDGETEVRNPIVDMYPEPGIPEGSNEDWANKTIVISETLVSSWDDIIEAQALECLKHLYSLDQLTEIENKYINKLQALVQQYVESKTRPDGDYVRIVSEAGPEGALGSDGIESQVSLPATGIPMYNEAPIPDFSIIPRGNFYVVLKKGVEVLGVYDKPETAEMSFEVPADCIAEIYKESDERITMADLISGVTKWGNRHKK